MKKKIIWILVLISLFSFKAFAQDSQTQLTIKLLFPKKSTSPITAPRPNLEPKEIYDSVFLDISPAPSEIERERYLVEYFLDGQLIYQTSGWNEQKPEQFSLNYILDTTKYKNGLHTLVINFWDKFGPSAIGIRELFINNISGEINE